MSCGGVSLCFHLHTSIKASAKPQRSVCALPQLHIETGSALPQLHIQTGSVTLRVTSEQLPLFTCGYESQETTSFNNKGGGENSFKTFRFSPKRKERVQNKSKRQLISQSTSHESAAIASRTSCDVCTHVKQDKAVKLNFRCLGICMQEGKNFRFLPLKVRTQKSVPRHALIF